MSLRRAPWRIGAVVALLLAGIWAAATLRFETELLPLMPPGLPSVRGLDEFQKHFISERELFVVADPAMPEAERAAAFQALRPALAAVPGIVEVVAPGEEVARAWPEIFGWAAWNLPPEQFGKVLAALAPEPVAARLAAVPDALAGALDPAELGRLQLDPLGLLEALGTPGNAAGEDTSGLAPFLGEGAPPFLILRAARPLSDFHESIAMADAVRGAVAATLPGERRLLLTGRPAFTAEISRQMRGDMEMMVGVAAVLVCVVFWLFYRTLRPLGWILFFQGLALLAGVVVARLAFGSLNVISMGFASILLGVSMDYSILVYHHFASSHRGDAAVWARLRGIWFSAATTAAAFLVLVFSSFPGLRQLATLVAVGLLASALFATSLLRSVLAKRPPSAPPILDRAAHAAANAIGRRSRWLLLLTLAIVSAAAWLLVRNPARFYAGDLTQFQPTTSDAWRGQEWLTRADTQTRDGIYLVRARSWGEVRAAAAGLAERVSGGRTSMWSHLLPAPENQTANRTAWPADTTARLRAQFDTAGLGEEWSAPTVALATAIERAAAGEPAAFRAAEPLLATLSAETGGQITALVRLPGASEKPVPAAGLAGFGKAEVFPVSWISLSDELTTLARGDLSRLGIWVLVAVVALCTLAQRSLRLVLLNFAALALALVLLALGLAVTGTKLSPLSLLAVPLLIGLVIDYSLHVLMALEHSRGDLRHTYGHLAAPVLLTGLSSCIGFGAPILTQQPALRNFGVVMDLGILAAVATCLVFLPLLYRATMPRAAENAR